MPTSCCQWSPHAPVHLMQSTLAGASLTAGIMFNERPNYPFGKSSAVSAPWGTGPGHAWSKVAQSTTPQAALATAPQQQRPVEQTARGGILGSLELTVMSTCAANQADKCHQLKPLLGRSALISPRAREAGTGWEMLSEHCSAQHWHCLALRHLLLYNHPIVLLGKDL